MNISTNDILEKYEIDRADLLLWITNQIDTLKEVQIHENKKGFLEFFWLKYPLLRSYDIISVNIRTKNIIDQIKYNILCNHTERIIHKRWIYIFNKYQRKWYWLYIMNNLIQTARKIWCHSIYADCAKSEIHNWSYSRAMMWYDFDHEHEYRMKVEWKSWNNTISRKKIDFIEKTAAQSLEELFAMSDWKQYRRDNNFGFQGKFDLTDGSYSMRKIEEYKQFKWWWSNTQ